MHQSPDVELHVGDCLPIVNAMAGRSVELAYLDPPFFTQRVHRLAPRDRSREFSFEDLWSSTKEYGTFLLDRLRAVRCVLSDRGSLFFHCDRNAVHIARFLLDEVFGSGNFRSEIVWHYRRWSNSRRGLLPSHQTILYYTKSDDYIFNEIRTEYSPATNVDQILQRRSRDEFNKCVYDRDENGKAITNGNKRGVPLGDVWDVPFLNPKAKERVGYPTQKPILLLERIIRLASNDGDCVLDPFCGSGTTLVAAQSLGRKAIGIDISEEAVALTKRRLRKSFRSRSRVLELGREAYRNADEGLLAMLKGLPYILVQRNSGIDAILMREYAGGPVPIRVQRTGETLLETASKLATASAGKGAKLMFLIATARGGSLGFPDEFPRGVIVIESPALGIRDYLDRMHQGGEPTCVELGPSGLQRSMP